MAGRADSGIGLPVMRSPTFIIVSTTFVCSMRPRPYTVRYGNGMASPSTQTETSGWRAMAFAFARLAVVEMIRSSPSCA